MIRAHCSPRQPYLFLALATLLTACDDSDSADGTTTSSGAGTGASSSLASTASASSGSGTGGGGGSGPTHTASVVVVNYATKYPVVGVHVIGNDPDGAIIDETDTDADGKATVNMPIGGSISALEAASYTADGKLYLIHNITTIEDPPEGVTATVYASGGASSGAPLPNNPMGTISVSVTGLPVGAKSVQLSLSCYGYMDYNVTAQGTLPPMSVVSYKGCSGKTTFSASAIAFDANKNAMSMALLPNLPFQSGQAKSLTFPLTQVGQTLLDAAVVNLDSDVTRAYIDFNANALDNRTLRYYVDQSPPASTQTTLHLGLPSSGFDSYQLGLSALRTDNAGTALRLQGPLAVLSNVTLDATRLARVEGLTRDLSDPSHPVFAWTLSAGDLGDGVASYWTWGTDTVTASWTAIVAPANDAHVRMPDLPAEYADWLPTAGQFIGPNAIEHTDALGLSGFPEWLPTNIVAPTGVEYSFARLNSQ